METVIVIGSYVMGYGVIRSFANKPVKIVALSYENVDFAHRSRYVDKWYTIPHPRKNEQEFINFLINKSNEWKDAVIFDTDDNVASTISKNKDILLKYYKIVAASWDMMKIFLEKKNAWNIALKAGVPHPINYTPNSKSDFEEIKKNLKFPILLKPVRGHEFKAKFNKKNFEVRDIQEYDNYVDKCLEAKQEVMVQEIVPGPDTNIYKCLTYINSQNQVAGLFFYNKIRQNPPRYGVHRVCTSAPRNEEVLKLLNKLLESSGYKGFLTVEFKKDPRDGSLKFIEGNVRMPRNIFLTTAAGVNFPWIIYKDLMHNEQIYFDTYNDHMYWIEIYADILNSIFKHSLENYSIKDYLRPYFSKDKIFAIFNWKDPIPFLVHTFKLPRVIFRRD
jgi:predicted ATP-grasp superfamily ATP-dependent carboligase